MNVALFTDTYPPFINGVSTSVYNLAHALMDHGHNVIVITPRSDDGELEYKDNVLRIPGLEMKKLYGYRLTKVYSSEAFNIVKDFEPDIIHNQTDSTVAIFAKICSRQLGVPIVYTYHTSIEDYTYYITKGFFDRLAKMIVRSYSNSVAKNTTEYITPSIKIKEFMRYAGNDIYVNVIPTGINFSLFQKDKVDQEKMKAFKEERGITDKTKIFLILGRIAKEKSMDISIRCFANYHFKHPEVDKRLIIVGNGPQRAELEEIVNELRINDVAEFIGAVPASEVPFYYNLADIYTSASVTETQGLTFMEAMVSGAIVIARYDDNLNDVIVEGKTGFYFTNEETFTQKVEKIFEMSEEKLEQIKKQALEICDVYSIENFYKNILEVYNRAIRKYW
ncbi:MAG: glycosyltransferase [Bacilli bacterium]|nr:glycosyltransferase [Bacilli bacterium]